MTGGASGGCGCSSPGGGLFGLVALLAVRRRRMR
jgi:uncharacterized protein (TIGR03382 family)